MREYLSFETERLWLRPMMEIDAAFLVQLLNSPKWLQYIGDRNVHSEEDARQYIQTKMLPQLERLGFSNYMVIRKVDGVKMGSCGLYDREGMDGVDIGFAFLPAYEGQGYGYESAYRILQAGWEDFRLQKVQGITLPENIASRRLLEKLGLHFIKMINLPNDKAELMLYEIKKGSL